MTEPQSTAETARDLTAAFGEHVKHAEATYEGDEDRPLRSFVALMGAFGGAVTAGGLVLRRKRALPERIDARDLALVAVATHKVSRLLAKAPVTSPLRAPFTRFAGTSGPAELREEVRGTGARKAMGELVTCPFCLAQWVGSSFLFGLALAPRATRMVAGMFAVTAASDFLQLAHAAAEKATNSDGAGG